MDLQGSISVTDSLIISAFSMLLVFAVLIIIFLIVSSFKLFFSEDEVKEDEFISEKNIVSNVQTKTTVDNEEKIATIIAALTMYNIDNSKEFKITNIKKQR